MAPAPAAGCSHRALLDHLASLVDEYRRLSDNPALAHPVWGPVLARPAASYTYGRVVG